MSGLPQHKFSANFDFGVHLRRMESPTGRHTPVAYAHQDDYYIFGLVEDGSVCCVIDFNVQHLQCGDIFLIQPGQVHRFIRSENAKGWLLIVDSSFVDKAEKHIFDDFSLFKSSFRMDEQRKNELRQIALLLAGRVGSAKGQQSRTTIRHLAETFISIVSEAVQDIDLRKTSHSRRHTEIILSFRRLLTERLAVSRKPSYYASLLNISTVYLNEVVKNVCKMSATQYIKKEVVLQAKRLLVFTNLTTKEIADRLGINDCAYFSRLFTRATGITPTSFRQKNLE